MSILYQPSLDLCLRHELVVEEVRAAEAPKKREESGRERRKCRGMVLLFPYLAL